MPVDPRNLRPSELCRLLNSTSQGEVIEGQALRRHRISAGMRISPPDNHDRVDILRYAAWLISNYHGKLEESNEGKIDVDAVEQAITKLGNGKVQTKRQQAELEKFDRLADMWVRVIPKRTYQAWTGRKGGSDLNKQGDLYGLPLRGRTLSIPMVLAGFHDFLAKNKRQLQRDAPEQDGNSSALEEYRRWKAKHEEVRYHALVGKYVERENVNELLGIVGTRIERARDALEKSHGPKAARVLADALDGIDRESQECLKRKADVPEPDDDSEGIE